MTTSVNSSPSRPARRVVITGLGVICPLGNSVADLWQALTTGRSGVQPLSLLPALPQHVTFGGEARDFTGSIDNFGPLSKDRKKSIRKALKVMCRETMMAVAAAQHAVADAGFCEQPLEPTRSGVVFGSDYMLSPPEDFVDAMVTCDAHLGQLDYPRWGTAGLKKMSPLWMLQYLPNMPGSHIAIFNDLRGPNNSLTLREVSGLMAVREAVQTIERGHADRMLAGATGTRIHSFKTLHAIQQEQLADPDLPPAAASRPFDAERTGMVVGEGAGAILLEELASARQRGATIYGEVLGTGSSTVTDAQLQGQPTAALTTAAQHALQQSDLAPAQLGHIHAHGLGTPRSDLAEATAVARICGAHSRTIPLVAAKSYFGNLGAASGLVELIASTKALQTGQLFPTLNYATPDPAAPPLAVTTESATAAGDSFLKLSVTPQAQAAAVVVARVADEVPTTSA